MTCRENSWVLLKLWFRAIRSCRSVANLPKSRSNGWTRLKFKLES